MGSQSKDFPPGHMAPPLAASVAVAVACCPPAGHAPSQALQATAPEGEAPAWGGDGGSGGWVSSRRGSLTSDTVVTRTRHETGRMVSPEPGARLWPLVPPLL